MCIRDRDRPMMAVSSTYAPIPFCTDLLRTPEWSKVIFLIGYSNPNRVANGNTFLIKNCVYVIRLIIFRYLAESFWDKMVKYSYLNRNALVLTQKIIKRENNWLQRNLLIKQNKLYKINNYSNAQITGNYTRKRSWQKRPTKTV